MVYIASIDVGWQHLAFAIVLTDHSLLWNIRKTKLINLKELKHKRVKSGECKLNHSNNASDLLDHFFQEYGHFFDDVSLVLIEKQPPTGLVVVEQLLYSHFKSKAMLVYPKSMIAHFGLPDNRELRKKKVEQLALRWMPSLKYHLKDHYDRVQDICDCVMFIKYFLDKYVAPTTIKCSKYFRPKPLEFKEPENKPVWL